MTWNNSDHNYLYGSVGSCHTPEEAHRVLSERHLQPLKAAIRECEHGRKEREIERAILQRDIAKCDDDLDRAKLQLALEKVGIHEAIENESYAYALHEVEFVQALIARIEPHCMWHRAEMSVEEGYQLAQQEERRLLLLQRARIGLLATGGIDSETLREAMSHPQMQQLESDMQVMLDQARHGHLRMVHPAPMALLSSSNS